MKNPFGLLSIDREVVSSRLTPLIRHLRYYDGLRTDLEKKGGTVADLKKITAVLMHPVFMGMYEAQDGSLADIESLRSSLFYTCGFNVILDVRQLRNEMPVYYLCRVRRDFWCEYSLVVEDYYRSPGYPVLDDRFVRFMVGGHEKYHLRLSPFRQPVSKMLMRMDRFSEEKTDDLLYKLGRHLYQAAWHEDQVPAFLCANHFGLKYMKQAIELLYVCLSAELCELRAAIDEEFLWAFETVEGPHPIGRLLCLLSTLEGSGITEIPRLALKLYCRLNQEFSRLLKVEVSLRPGYAPLPFYKLLFANLNRLEMLASTLKENPAFEKAARTLENEARNIVEEILQH